MAIQSFPGSPLLLGPRPWIASSNGQSLNGITINAVNMAHIQIGRARTSDGASHTINTTGSSKFGFRSGSTNTFASGSTTVKVGLAAVDTSNGPAARPVNSSNVITFDCSADVVGGSITWNNNVWMDLTPTTGSKTVADGDLVAYCLQMTARGGSDAVNWDYPNLNNNVTNLPTVSLYNGSYSNRTAMPSGIWRFADGAYGWIEGSDTHLNINTRAFSNASSPNQYGQLFNMPFAMRVCGVYGQFAVQDLDVVLYSDPLGSPVAERTVSHDANTVSGTSGNFSFLPFSSPYDVSANTSVAVVMKPTTGSNINSWYKTLNHADHRYPEAYGVTGYGVSRTTSGAFSNANSSLDHYYVGLMLNGFDAGGGGGGGGSGGVIGS